jgi:hypothetical protein
MTDRRSLTEGLKRTDLDRAREAEFVYQGKNVPAVTPATEAAPKADLSLLPPRRSPLTSKIRSDFVEALKRASLERQLAGVRPYQLQDILEAALEPWLKDHGYLK